MEDDKGMEREGANTDPLPPPQQTHQPIIDEVIDKHTEEEE